MKSKNSRLPLAAAVSSATALWLLGVDGVAAQEYPDGASATRIDEIIVTARRRDESLQDVPVVINTVTAQDLDRLQLRQFADVQALVPGLNLGADNLSPSVSLRGVNFDTAASGNNPTVEFYLNEAPIQSGGVLQAMYDVGQIEVLRGPQGTLRGRASPSGSITVTTNRPDLEFAGGHINMSLNNVGGENVSGAISIPVVKDKLAVRIAGLHDDNENTRIKSINSGESPYARTRAGRVSVLFQPLESLSLSLIHESLNRKGRSFSQVESASIADPDFSPGPVFISAGDRRAVVNHGNDSDLDFEQTNFQLEWTVGGQRINYVGARHTQEGYTYRFFDEGDFFGPPFPENYKIKGQITSVDIEQVSHELRLASDERLLGRFDYVVGFLRNENDNKPTTIRPTLVVLGAEPTPTTATRVVETLTERSSKSKENSIFGNLTWHITDATELSLGLRYIDYEVQAGLVVNGATLAGAAQDDDFSKTVYTASLKHNLSDNLMVYAAAGTSWRPGISVVGDFSLSKTPLQQSFQLLPPETSTSYEVGFKSSLFEDRLRFNAAVFYQKFDDYPYRPVEGVYYVETANNPAPPPATIERINTFNFVGPVSVDVKGIELDFLFQPAERWNLSGVFAYAKGEIKNGLIPCNDYFPADGIPDSVVQVPTIGQIRGATGGDNLSGCNVSYRSHNSPRWSATLQSEYTVLETSAFDVYLRGMLSIFGSSQGDPVNSFDNVSGYSILNLYSGIRDQEGVWEISVYGKNVLNTERVLTREGSPYTLSYTSSVNGSQTRFSTYRGISMTPAREFGVNLKYNFNW